MVCESTIFVKKVIPIYKLDVMINRRNFIVTATNYKTRYEINSIKIMDIVAEYRILIDIDYNYYYVMPLGDNNSVNIIFSGMKNNGLNKSYEFMNPIVRKNGSESYFNIMPNEIIQYIFDYLNKIEVRNMIIQCRLLYTEFRGYFRSRLSERINHSDELNTSRYIKNWNESYYFDGPKLRYITQIHFNPFDDIIDYECESQNSRERALIKRIYNEDINSVEFIDYLYKKCKLIFKKSHKYLPKFYKLLSRAYARKGKNEFDLNTTIIIHKLINNKTDPLLLFVSKNWFTNESTNSILQYIKPYRVPNDTCHRLINRMRIQNNTRFFLILLNRKFKFWTKMEKQIIELLGFE